MLRFSTDGLRCGCAAALFLACNSGCAEGSPPMGTGTAGTSGPGANAVADPSPAGNSAGAAMAGNSGGTMAGGATMIGSPALAGNTEVAGNPALAGNPTMAGNS